MFLKEKYNKTDQSLEAKIWWLRYKIIGVAFALHDAIGPGLLESAYQKMLTIDLEQLGHNVKREVYLDIFYKDVRIDRAYRADLIVDDVLLIELKATEYQDPSHLRQVSTYIKLVNMPFGLLLNFGMNRYNDVPYRIDNPKYNPNYPIDIQVSEDQKNYYNGRTFIQPKL